MDHPTRTDPQELWYQISRLLVLDLEPDPFLGALGDLLEAKFPHLEVTRVFPTAVPDPQTLVLSFFPGGTRGLLVRSRGEEGGAPGDRETFVHLGALLEAEGQRRKVRWDHEPEQGLLRSILDSASEVIYAKDREGRFVVVNQVGARRLGYRPEDLVGRTHLEIEPTYLAQRLRTKDEEVLATGQPQEQEYTLVRQGTERTYLSRKSPWKDGAGNIIGVIGVSADITDRKRADEEVKSLLKEKEFLLQEVHHRIKNNMGTVIALLTIHAEASGDPRVQASLEEAQNRIYSMMLLYDKLYQTPGHQNLSVPGYFSVLVDQILNTFPNRSLVWVEKHLEDFTLPASQAQQVGILVNELLTNSMKYAFPGRRPGVLGVSITREGPTVVVTVEDDGVGFTPSQGAEGPQFGMSLVHLLTQGLGGHLEVDVSRGTRVTVRF